MHRHVVVSLLLLSTMIFVVATSSLHVGQAVVNVGTTLYKRNDLTRTWTTKEAIRLHGRMLVDQLLPRRVPEDGATFIKYLKLIVDKSRIVEDVESRKHIMVMVADAMGGYMHGVLLVKIKASYYEGQEAFNVTNTLYGILRKIKFILDTDGRGWMNPVPERKVTNSSSRRSSRSDDYESFTTGNACDALYPVQPTYGGTGPTVIPVPTFDDDLRPGSLAVPFSAGRRLYPVDGPGLTDGVDGGPRPLLARYYRLALECAASTGTADRFAADVRRWLDETVAPLLAHPHRWYPVLAGASRVIRAATSAGRDVAARNMRRRRTAPDDDVLRACDDGTDGRLPNSNVFLLVNLLSLTSTWLCFGLFVFRKTST